MDCSGSRLAALHRLARRCSFYPLGCSTAVAGVLLAARSAYGGRGFSFLVWNLFLAWIPYLASLWAEAGQLRRTGQWQRLILPGAIWLLFLPNGPYIVTDLIHLHRARPPIPLWYDALLVLAFAWAGCLLAVVSLRIMQARVRAYAGPAAAWAFALAVIALCGPGVYMGRVLRWNSWDVLTRPAGMLETVLGAVTDPLAHWPAIAVSLILAGFMLGGYVIFVTLQTRRAEEESGLGSD